MEDDSERELIAFILEHIDTTSEQGRKELLRAAINLWAMGKRHQRKETEAAMFKKYKISNKYGELFAVANFILKRDRQTEQRFNERISTLRDKGKRRDLQRRYEEWKETASLTQARALREANKLIRTFVEGSPKENTVLETYRRRGARL